MSKLCNENPQNVDNTALLLHMLQNPATSIFQKSEKAHTETTAFSTKIKTLSFTFGTFPVHFYQTSTKYQVTAADQASATTSQSKGILLSSHLLNCKESQCVETSFIF